MNYICNLSAGVCCALVNPDKLELAETTVLIDRETGQEVSTFSWVFVPGRTYRCEKRWTIRQSYNHLKSYETEAEAQQAYAEIVRLLSNNNTIIEI